LLIHTGPLRNTRFPVERPSVVLGRSSLSDVTLPDLQASRRHARLEWHSDGLYLVDNHSTNGTYVNSRPIEQVRLFGGEQVQIGGTIFTIRLY
jgi:pSer/pThr/pTyr-binding forkhead associated (FHA) protein